eukprot:gnl/TRDRNA2_/TRDRNA2_140559_c0_seq5.p1 gnl/TRDRNA2_/TRDRNA2_140559_c0~~gnl/TRDRNA2_/TRDRNA2_140559_c0_seq5.p1  ORF type:complete len:254 (-),score=5.67 gnl/TRDRNA2_/TRDRNA2_140559_c0_seq5:477-1238(-)
MLSVTMLSVTYRLRRMTRCMRVVLCACLLSSVMVLYLVLLNETFTSTAEVCITLPETPCIGGVPPKSQLQGTAALYLCNAMRRANSTLIFGTGHDSPMWVENTNGELVFLEHHSEWVGFQPKSVQDRTHIVHYTTVLESWWWPWKKMPSASHFARFINSLPHEVRSRQWDVILVDSPEGYGGGTPGRSSSIFAARALLRSGGIVFVDDYQREGEQRFVAELFPDFHYQVFDNGHKHGQADRHNGRTIAICSGV